MRNSAASVTALVLLGAVSLVPDLSPTDVNAAQPVTIEVSVDHPGGTINPAMWGVFFEDINFGADGGLFAELVKNRSFEFPEPLMGWTVIPGQKDVGTWSVQTEGALSPANAHYLRLGANTSAPFGVANEGFRGIGIKAGELYDFSVRVRQSRTSAVKALKVELVGLTGQVLASGSLTGFTPEWRKRTLKLRPSGTESKARLQVTVIGPGFVDVDVISLFPRKTWKGRPEGLRADLVQMLADLKPGFVRFPGDCIVEGRYLTNRYDWKSTIGPVEDRRLIINRWNNEFAHRPTPDYFQSFGLGFFEYFQMCEDIGAEPLPILNCGMACQFNSGELVPISEIDPFIRDCLDLIEFANGTTQTSWGAKRAALGHPAPFGMKLLGIGNEQWGPQYIERYARFSKVLKERHPEVKLVSSVGPEPADDRFRSAWKALQELHADIIDEHCYAAPKWFLDNAHRYDNYERTGPKVFMGEYAAQSSGVAKPDNRNNLECALAEAAYLTGLERNADVVRMASYAPLFGSLDAWQWTPNLIWSDNLTVFGTPNYYVQQLFSRNRGDVILPAKLSGDSPGALFASAVRDSRSGEVILKVVNPFPNAISATIKLAGASRVAGMGSLTLLAGTSPGDENRIEDPRRVAPIRRQIPLPGAEFQQSFPPYSANVIRVKAR